MKCPKCGYLGFEQVDRCRNCQYDFSLTSPIPEPDFAIRRDTQTAKLLDDLPLANATGDWPSGKAAGHIGADLDRIFGAPEPVTEAAIPRLAVAGASPVPREELPLFGPPIPEKRSAGRRSLSAPIRCAASRSPEASAATMPTWTLGSAATTG